MKTYFLSLSLFFLGCVGLFGQQLQLRSTPYDGSNGFITPHQAAYTESVSITVEAWVFPETTSGLRTILSQGFGSGMWFGLQDGKLRFSRSGGLAATSTGQTLKRKRWVHVAASYDGTRVRFYLDGSLDSTVTLDHRGSGTSRDLQIARDGIITAPFIGNLDEIRLWSLARNGSQVAASVDRELRGISSLVGIWPRGDGLEAIRETAGTAIGERPLPVRGGILPQELVVPLAANNVVFDGDVNVSSEYVGGEEIVLRYLDNTAFEDATAYLVHDNEYLYVGITRSRLRGAGDLIDTFSVRVDTDGTSTTFDGELKEGQVRLPNDTNFFNEVSPFTIGNITIMQWASVDPVPDGFSAKRGLRTENEFLARDLEFRFRRNLLGDLAPGELDRLMIQHFRNESVTGDRRWPEDGDRDDSATWAELRYVNIPGEVLPEVRIQARVRNTQTNSFIPNLQLVLSGREGVISTRTSSASEFSTWFNQPVGVDEPLTLQLLLPEQMEGMPPPFEGWRIEDPIITEDGIQPTLVRPREVRFPGCVESRCVYAQVTFELRPPLPATTIADVQPQRTWPRLLVRGGADPKLTAGGKVTVTGENLHEFLEFYFVRGDCPRDLRDCVEGRDYFEAIETALLPAGDGLPRRIEVTVPDIGPELFGNMRLTAHDTWRRAENGPSGIQSWLRFEEFLRVDEPPYHLLHGFSFVNRANGHDFDDYRAAFFDEVCSPLRALGTLAFFPVYLEILGNGECVGMTVTAQQFSKGRDIASLEGDVFYANGFRPLAGTANEAPVPATFNVGNFCSPAPTNVWAAIKANHGVQLSSEFIGKLLEQFSIFQDGLISINLRNQVARLRDRLLDKMVCFAIGERGHCVQPLRVIDVDPNNVRIEIWDCNRPEQTRFIEIDLAANRYTYEFGGDDTWVGNWLFVYEVDPIYNQKRHVPSIEQIVFDLSRFGVTHLWEFFQLFVSGEAEPLVTAGDGSQIGWANTGEFFESTEETVLIPNFNWILGENPPLGHHPMGIFHSPSAGIPSIEVQNRGERYFLHGSHHGSMFQFEVNGGVNGTTDQVSCRHRSGSNQILGFNFRAGERGRTIESRMTLCRDNECHPLGVIISPVAVPEGTQLGIEILPDATGFLLDNDTGVTIRPRMEVLTAGDFGNPDQPWQTGIVNFPILAGARLSANSLDGVDLLNLAYTLDIDRDGVPEERRIYQARTGSIVPFVDPAEVYPEIEHLGDGSIRLIRPESVSTWIIQHSETLDGDWEDLDLPDVKTVIEDGMVISTIPATTAIKRFFRLAL